MQKHYLPANYPLRILLMRISLATIVLTASLSSVFATSRLDAQSLSDVKIHTKDQSLLLVDFFRYVEDNSSYQFIYSSDEIDPNKRVELRSGNYNLRSLLEKVSVENKLRFEKIKNTIIVTQSENTAKPDVKEVPTRSIYGKVTDEQGQSLPGATVLVKGTAIGTTTDSKGEFALDVPDDAKTLLVSFIGFITQEASIEGKTEINITLKEDAAALDEVVVIGYGSQNREKVTGAISKVSSKDFKDQPINSLDQAMVGQMSGVDVVQVSGEPGANASFRIRGLSSISAGNEPLVVVDGMPVSYQSSLATINPNDIESIEVLKDASAASIYGSRGANGVVLITTKKGRPGKTRYSFNSFFGWQEVSNKVDMMDAYEYANYMNVAFRNNWIRENPGQPVPTNPLDYGVPEYAVPYVNGEQGLTNTDWQDEIYRIAPMQNYEITAQGGSKDMNFYISANYLNQEGIMLGTDFERVSFRTNLEINLSRKLKLGVNLMPSFSQANRISDDNYGNDGIIITSLVAYPFFPAYNSDGTPAISNQINAVNEAGFGAPVENPVALATMIDNTRQNYRLLGGTYLDYEIIKGLNYKVYLGGDLISQKDNYFRPGELGVYRNAAPTIPVGEYTNQVSTNWILENTLTYNKTIFENHNFNLLLGYTAQKENIETGFISSTDFPSDDVQTLNAGAVTDASTYINEWSLLSQLARLTYDYKGKYLFNASIRRDGSSRFGDNNKYGVFPAVSAGYIISKEDFFPKNKYVSTVKVRASWGKSGNFFIPNYGAVSLLSFTDYPFGGEVNNGLSSSTAPNANLSWEKTDMTDIGLDLGLLDDKISLIADYFYSTTEDLLLNVPVPAQSGYTTSLQNIGKVENRGYELGINTNFTFGSLNWQGGFTYTASDNKVLELGPDQEHIRTWFFSTEVGGELGAYWGFRNLGVFISQEQIDNYGSVDGAEVGRSYRWQDTDGDGEITEDDKVYLGSFFPDFSFNISSRFNYKGIDLSFLIQSVQGHEIVNITKNWTVDQGPWPNRISDLNDYYRSPDNPGTYVYPDTRRTDNNYRRSDLLIEDGSFVRIRNITLGYTLPSKWMERLPVERLRFYFTTNNPFTFTNYSGPNPEISSRNGNALTPGIDYGTYPLAKTYAFGVNVNF